MQMSKMCLKQMRNITIFFATIWLHLGFVTGINLTNVSIPYYGVKGGTAQLLCDFTLETDPLLVLKWYRGEQEFFRYTPMAVQNILTFPVEGVYVDIPQSSLTTVTLKNISLETSGFYKCEVSADKTFTTKSRTGHMIVIAPPLKNPEILGVHSRISIGDRVSGNCTSYRSKPAVSLTFYINNEKAETGDLIEYSPLNDTDGLETSVLGFNFTVEPRHFPKPGTKVELKCTATIGNFYWVKSMTLAEANVNPQPSYSGHNRHLSGGGARGTSTCFFYMSIIQVMIVCRLISFMANRVIDSRHTLSSNSHSHFYSHR